MITKAPAVQVEKSEPFKGDVLQRKKYADILTAVLAPVTEPFVITINSGFGTGKSTFVRMWRQQLQNAGYTTLFFNAWENDFTEHALISMLGELRGELKPTSEKKLLDSTVKAGKILGKAAIPVLVRVLTAGAVDSEQIGNAAGDLTEKIAEERIKSYEADKETIKAFKRELGSFVKKRSPNKPVFFFIDELDRCRPTYAIEVLEHTKHLFDVPGLIFILSVDREQLGHSIRAVYGSNLNIDGYLRRFIDLDYRLPPPAANDFVVALCEGVDSIPANWRAPLQEALSFWATVFRFSLRTIEQTFTHALLVSRVQADRNIPQILFVTLVCMRAHDTAFYYSYVADATGREELLKLLEPFYHSEYASERRLSRNLRVMLAVFPLTNEQVKHWVKERQEAAQGEPDADEKRYIQFEIQQAEEFNHVRYQKKLILDSIEVTRDFLKPD